MTWQAAMLDELARLAGAGGRVEPYGSVVDGDLDAWSDLDADLVLPGRDLRLERIDGAALWTYTPARDRDLDVYRIVLDDGRRIDLRVSGGRLLMPEPPPDDATRFDLALAAARCGRGDALIGTHLLLDVLRECLVLAMEARDAAAGTRVHRSGGALDARADEARAIAALPVLDLSRPHPTELAAELYGRWRAELEPDYTSDWSGLTAVLDRGTGVLPAT
jgi:hypothetical protein